MRALTVRDKSTGALLCFGPDNGMYDPGVPANGRKQFEPNYDTVLAEWQAAHANDKTPRDLFREEVTAANSVADLKTILLKYDLI